ncbi:MAG: hypothetical protein IPJ03_18475 [Ignavibacteriales bacterium]|nr:hypothetical protein [Ignavibacteriales bacterium]
MDNLWCVLKGRICLIELLEIEQAEVSYKKVSAYNNISTLISLLEMQRERERAKYRAKLF